MSLLNQVFQGNPNSLGVAAAGGSQVAPNVALDSVDGTLFMSTGSGWTPLTGVAAKGAAASQTAADANVLTFAVPVSGMYEINFYTVQATATSGTLPAVDVAFTDATLASAATAAVAGVATTGKGQSQSGVINVNAQAGTNIVVSTGAPTSLTYNIQVRISYLG